MTALAAHYTPEHHMFRDTCRRFFEKQVVPFHMKWEEEGMVPRELWRTLWQFWPVLLILLGAELLITGRASWGAAPLAGLGRPHRRTRRSACGFGPRSRRPVCSRQPSDHRPGGVPH